MKFLWIAALLTAAAIGVGVSKYVLSRKPGTQMQMSADTKIENYWTCPMHPQIHQPHSAECPICHMKLVQVKAEPSDAAETVRSDVHASASQLELLGVQKEKVERMDLNLSIPVSGRLISSSTVAFQIYESDLHFIRPGLHFEGQSTFAADGAINGVITNVDSIVDPTSRTIRVLGQIQNGPRGLIAETTFSGVIFASRKDAVAIPESSVLHTGTGDLVYVFTEQNKLTARKVMLGAKSEGFYEVVSGLVPGEEISSGPNFLIDSESKIRGVSETGDGQKASTPDCGAKAHWDIPMAMCMPGKASSR